MKLLAFAGFALAIAAAPALANKDTDYPHRDWGQVATLDMSASDAVACVTRELAREYERIVPVPVEGGGDIDGGPGGGFFGVVHDPWERWQVRTEAGATVLRVFYRHPSNRKSIGKSVVRFQKRCLKIASLSPSVTDGNLP